MDLLPLGLAFVVGLVFGYAIGLWRRLSAVPLDVEPDTEPGLRQCVSEHAPLPAPSEHGFYRSRRRFGSGCVPFKEDE